jgi:feruloyl esterase
MSVFNWPFSIAVILLGLQPASAAEPLHGTSFSGTCAELAKNNTIVASATIEAALFGSGKSCVVRGKVISSSASTINFRVDLPEVTSWNGKLLMIGGAGFDGIVPTDAPNRRGFWFAKLFGSDAERIAGYIIASSDSGHQGRGQNPIEDFSWVSQNPTALANHGYEANHIVLGVAIDLSAQLYAKPPQRRYIVGGPTAAVTG